jgi:hypothetical protein
MDEVTRRKLIDRLLEGVPKGRQEGFLKDMLETVLRYAEDDAPVNELKLVSRSMREMRYAGTVFRKFADQRKVAVFGSARTRAEEPDFQLAREFARRITAGPDGAGADGAREEGAVGLAVMLPSWPNGRARSRPPGEPDQRPSTSLAMILRWISFEPA